MLIKFENGDDNPLEVVVEPSLKKYQIPARTEFDFEIPDSVDFGDFKVDYFSANFISVWGPVDARILIDGAELPFIFA